MDIAPEKIIDALLEDVKRLTLENAALRTLLADSVESTPEVDGDE